MKTEVAFHEGMSGRPLVVLIHGMGMDLRIWTSPAEVKVLAGTYPLSVILDERYRDMPTVFPALKEMGMSILSWSQSRPSGPLEIAVQELRDLLAAYQNHARNGVILIGHSRGGLVGRKYAEEHPGGVLRLITLATPHRGTTLARWSGYISPLASFARVIADVSRGDIARSVKRIAGFLQSSGLKELLPDSPLIQSLKTRRPAGVRCASFGGTTPDLVKIGGLSLLEVFGGVLPDIVVPEEIRPGMGDGLVSSASSVLPYAERHMDFPLNHVAMLFDARVREAVLREVEEMA